MIISVREPTGSAQTIVGLSSGTDSNARTSTMATPRNPLNRGIWYRTSSRVPGRTAKPAHLILTNADCVPTLDTVQQGIIELLRAAGEWIVPRLLLEVSADRWRGERSATASVYFISCYS